MSATDRRGGPSRTEERVDFDLHGIVGIRLLEAAAEDLIAVKTALGRYESALDREPDVTVRFQDLSTPGLQLLGLHAAGYTSDAFYLLDGSDQVSARIPFDRIGERCELVYRRGQGSVPLLQEIIRLTCLKKGYVPLHGAAFCYNDKGILVAGWSKGGKTEALLAFANHGARYVADEWVLLSGDGECMLGLPVRVALWDWQLEQVMPDLRPELSTETRLIFGGIHSLEAVHRRLARSRLKSSRTVRALGRLVPMVQQGLSVRMSPQSLFKDRFLNEGAPIDKLFLVMSHSQPGIVVKPCDPADIAQRMVHSNEYEEAHLQQRYRAFKFAFPTRVNPTLEGAAEMRSSLLLRALEGKEAYRVLHPYPVSFEELFRHMRPLC
jgi:hypothetical protein